MPHVSTSQGDFTEYCTIEAKSFENDIDKYNKLGAQIVGVSGDTEDSHLDFSKTYGLDFPLLSDQGMSSHLVCCSTCMQYTRATV